MKELELRAKVREFSVDQEGNHQYEFPYGVMTRLKDIDSPGYNTNKWRRLLPIFSQMPKDLARTFLDVGCSDGYYCIEGAKFFKESHFTGIDLDLLRIKRARFAKDIFGIKNVTFEHRDLYTLISQDSKFDVVMGLGLLHRVPDLDKCIEDLLKVSKRYVIFEFKSAMLETSDFIDHGGKTKSNKLNGLYKTPSMSYVENKMKSMGFSCTQIQNDYSSLKFPRLIMVGEKDE